MNAVNVTHDNRISANEPEAKITNLNNTTGKALKDVEVSKDSSKNLLKMKHKLPPFSVLPSPSSLCHLETQITTLLKDETLTTLMLTAWNM